jgi:hypothetical protein
LRDAIRNRDVYGGISFGPQGRTLLIATGASPTVAQLLSQVGNGIGQWLPQGANATLLRSTAFFDGAGATLAIVALTCWVLAGAALIVIAAARNGKGVRVPR